MSLDMTPPLEVVLAARHMLGQLRFCCINANGDILIKGDDVTARNTALCDELYYTRFDIARRCRLVSEKVRVYTKFEHFARFRGVATNVISKCSRMDIEAIECILEEWRLEHVFTDIQIVNSTIDEDPL